MVFRKGELYHVYNQGNNKKKLFYNNFNYHLFIDKIKVYILPYADIIAWCLMPNHFHLMLLVKNEELNIENLQPTTPVEKRQFSSKKSKIKMRTLNDSIGILLRSYTRRINKENKFTGSLFRQATKANPINSLNELQANFWKSRISLTQMVPKNQYPQVCFNYIHHNPVKAGLVDNSIEWEYSSARDFANLREGGFVNKVKARKYVEL